MTLAPPAPPSPSVVAAGVRIGPRGLPKLTLGDQAALWAMNYLEQPDGPGAGQPWRYTDEQLRFLLWWYAVDARGRFVYRYALLRRMKGWGKDPFGATVCALEFVGPCRFSHFDARGNPVAKPHSAAWVQTAAVSKDQTRNTMTLFPGLFSKRSIEEYSIDLGKEIIYAHKGRHRLEAVTSSPRALEGGRATFVLKNEPHHWLENNDGLEMAAVIARNAAKSRDASARAMAITNAHNPGENSDAEADWDAWQKIESGTSRATGFLYDSLEAPADTVLADRESLRAGILAARGDSTWLDPDRLIEEIYDPRTPPSTARRFYLNQIVAAEDAYFAPHEWDQLALNAWPIAGRLIALGFDGSKTDDHSALIGCDVETGLEFVLGIWDPEDYAAGDEPGEIPRAEIDAAVQRARERWDVVGFYSDVHPFESYIDKWAEDFGEDLCVRATGHHPIGWDMRGRQQQTTRAAEAFHDAVLESVKMLEACEDAAEREALLASGELPITHDGDATFRQHVINARNRPNRWGMSFGKEHRSSSRKVDALASGVLARLARMDYIALPEAKKRQRKGDQVVGGFFV